MKKAYEYIDIYSDVISFISTGAHTADEILSYISEKAELGSKETHDISADGRYAKLRATLVVMLQEMLKKKTIDKNADGRYFSKTDVPVALRAEKCEHEILRLLSKKPLAKDKIREALTLYFGTEKTKTKRDDNMLNNFINETLKRLVKEEIIIFDGTKYSIPEEKYAIANDKKQLSGIKADFLSLLHARGGDFFEYYFMNLLSRYYKKMGKTVLKCDVTGGAADGGIDGIAITRDSFGFVETVMVQTKNRSDYATELDIRSFYGAVNAQKGTRGIYATTSGFHPMAQKLLDELDDCVGVGGDMIFHMARETGYGLKLDGEKIKIDTSVI